MNSEIIAALLAAAKRQGANPEVIAKIEAMQEHDKRAANAALFATAINNAARGKDFIEMAAHELIEGALIFIQATVLTSFAEGVMVGDSKVSEYERVIESLAVHINLSLLDTVQKLPEVISKLMLHNTLAKKD